MIIPFFLVVSQNQCHYMSGNIWSVSLLRLLDMNTNTIIALILVLNIYNVTSTPTLYTKTSNISTGRTKLLSKTIDKDLC